jgi:hypothetical protein
MTDTPAAVETAFEDHGSLSPDDAGATVTTTAFDGVVTAAPTDGVGHSYTVTVQAPTLGAATADEVGDAVATDWLRTFRRRLSDAPKATRAVVELESFTAEREGETVRVEYVFEHGNPTAAAAIATTFAEFVEGTYVEGIVPGYDYQPPVAGLLSQASQGGESGTPL